MEGCPACAVFCEEQTAMWGALDTWAPKSVSMGFNRALWQKIAAADSAPWYRRLADSLRSGAWKVTFPLAAAALLMAAGFMFDHQTGRVPPAGPGATVASGVSVSDAEQVEKTLDDIQLLRQFDAESVTTASSVM
ncbi:MAG: hypothetical protein ABJC09_12175 [Terriglobia bacterium]